MRLAQLFLVLLLSWCEAPPLPAPRGSHRPAPPRSPVRHRLPPPGRGFMDLVVEVLSRDRRTGAMVLSLAYYFTQHGDLCQDPEMELRVYPPQDRHPGRVEALTFQQAIPPIYQRVYPEPGMDRMPAITSAARSGRAGPNPGARESTTPRRSPPLLQVRLRESAPDASLVGRGQRGKEQACQSSRKPGWRPARRPWAAQLSGSVLPTAVPFLGSGSARSGARRPGCRSYSRQSSSNAGSHPEGRSSRW